MKSLLFYIIFLAFNCLSNQLTENYRIISKTGEKLPLYKGLYYGVSNKKSGHILQRGNKMIPPPIDPRNASHWIRGIFLSSNDNGIDGNYYLDKVDANYYRIIASTGGCKDRSMVDGEYLKNHDLAFSCCDGCSEFSDWFQWTFTEMPDYKLNAIMTDFQYEIHLEDVIKHVKKVDLLHTTMLTNDSPTKITEEISNEVKKTQCFEISYSKSIGLSAKFFAKYTAHASVSGKILGIGASANAITEFGMELGADVTTTNGNTRSVSNEVTYTIKKTVEVPPFEKVQLLSYVNWVDNLSIPYKARVTVNGVAPRFENDSRMDSKTMKALLSKYGFDERLIEETATSLTFEVHGIFTGSFGLDYVFSYTSLGKTRNTTNYYDVIASQSLAINGGYIISY